MKTVKIFSIFCILMISTSAHAFYDFNGTMVDVEAWTGTGENKTILVVDWNRIDTGPETLHESHAFGYRWDGVKYEDEMLSDFDSAGILTVTTGYGGGFVMNIGYDDGEEAHLHIEEGSWNLASTSDSNARWGTWGDSEWDFNTGGTDVELLVDGQYEGINAIMWFGSLPDYADDQLDIPIVPVPAAIWLIGSAFLCILGIRRRF